MANFHEVCRNEKRKRKNNDKNKLRDAKKNKSVLGLRLKISKKVMVAKLEFLLHVASRNYSLL